MGRAHTFFTAEAQAYLTKSSSILRSPLCCFRFFCQSVPLAEVWDTRPFVALLWGKTGFVYGIATLVGLARLDVSSNRNGGAMPVIGNTAPAFLASPMLTLLLGAEARPCGTGTGGNLIVFSSLIVHPESTGSRDGQLAFARPCAHWLGAG